MPIKPNSGAGLESRACNPASCLSITQSGLVGFYDCCMGEDKGLRVQYRFKGKVHDVTVSDEDPLKCPMRGMSPWQLPAVSIAAAAGECLSVTGV